MEEAFTELIKENEGLIYKIARIYTNTKADQDDLFQEIVIQIWKAFGKFRHEAQVSTWVYRIAMNTAISGLRKRKKHIINTSLSQVNLVYSEIKSNQVDDQLDFIYKCIGELNHLEKGIILLYLENKSYNQIAETMGMSESNVGTRISRIRQKIKTKAEKLKINESWN